MSIHKKPVYNPPDAPNPFLAGSDKAYADILLDKMQETKRLRQSAFLHDGLFLVALILFFYALSRQQTVPVLVNVMPSGESQYLGEVRQNGGFAVSEAQILYEIRSFVYKLRSVSTDYYVVDAYMHDCFNSVTQNFGPILRRILLEANQANPYDLVGKLRRTVEIESVLHVTGRSYQVNWTETVIEPSSSPKYIKMRAVITIRLETPTKKTIEFNPSGVYIENFEMTEL